MIFDLLKNAEKYTPVHPELQKAFDFLRQTHLPELPIGKHAITGDHIFAIADRTAGRSAADGRLEGHRRYIDIQYVISGNESIGWKSVAGLTACGNYCTEKDLIFFSEPPDSIIHVPPGHFALFFPEDAHLPLIGDGPIHKVVVKVAV